MKPTEKDLAAFREIKEELLSYISHEGATLPDMLEKQMVYTTEYILLKLAQLQNELTNLQTKMGLTGF